MKEIFIPRLQAAGLVVFFVGIVMVLVGPLEPIRVQGFATILLGGVAIAVAAAWVITVMTGPELPEPEFRRLVDRSEALAAMPPPENPPSEFDELVIAALDDLPERFQELLRETPVIVSMRGHEHRAYGHYIGHTIARDGYGDRIVIYQDTLERDFGHDPAALRAQVTRTVWHEVAHHLGWDEPGVRGLGL